MPRNAKWSKERRAKFEAERLEKNRPVVDNNFQTEITPRQNIELALDKYWSELELCEKLSVISHIFV